MPDGCVDVVGYHVSCVLVEVISRSLQTVISMDTFYSYSGLSLPLRLSDCLVVKSWTTPVKEGVMLLMLTPDRMECCQRKRTLASFPHHLPSLVHVQFLKLNLVQSQYFKALLPLGECVSLFAHVPLCTAGLTGAHHLVFLLLKTHFAFWTQIHINP